MCKVLYKLPSYILLYFYLFYCACSVYFMLFIFPLNSSIFTLDRVYIGRVSENVHTHPANSDREHSKGCWGLQSVAFGSVCKEGKVSSKYKIWYVELTVPITAGQSYHSYNAQNSDCCLSELFIPSCPIDSDWRIGMRIIRAVLCCTVHHSCVQLVPYFFR